MGDQKSSNTAICSLFGTIADAQQHCIAVIKQEADDSCSMDDDDDDVDANNRGHDMLGNDLVDSETLVNSLVNSSNSNNNKLNSDRFSTTTPRSSSNTPTSCLGVASGDAPKSGPGIGGGGSGSSASDELAAGIKRALHQQHQQHLQITARLFSACNNKSFAAALENCNSVINAAASSNLGDNCVVGATVPHNNNNSNNTNNNNNNNNHLGNVTSNSNNSSCSNNNGSSSGAGNNYLLPCPLCEVPLEPRVFRQHLDRHYPRDSPICPVIQCGRRFAHPNSVRNHMRLKHTLQWAKMKAMRSSGGPFTGIP